MLHTISQPCAKTPPSPLPTFLLVILIKKPHAFVAVDLRLADLVIPKEYPSGEGSRWGGHQSCTNHRHTSLGTQPQRMQYDVFPQHATHGPKPVVPKTIVRRRNRGMIEENLFTILWQYEIDLISLDFNPCDGDINSNNSIQMKHHSKD